MSILYDVIVVGARCAGSPTAMLLARRGYKVLLVDRSTFPSEIGHGHFIHRHGPRRLRDWGLLDQLVATGCPPATTISLDVGAFSLVGKDLVRDGIAAGYGPRRGALDKVLVDAAVKAGVEVRENFSVEEFKFDGNRIIGIRGRDHNNGAIATEHAIITVGADGRDSTLARAARAPEYEVHPTLTCWYFSYWADVPSTGLELYVRGKRMIFAFPTNDNLFAVFVAWPIDEKRVVQSDHERQFLAVVEQVPELAARIREGQRAERFYGAANLPNFLRKPYGPGWALVGDAGCHKDPYLALGICDAMRDADQLTEAIDAGLSGRKLLDDALAEYERRRNEESMADYKMNLDLAQFKPPSFDERRILMALRGNQEMINQFFMAREGMIPPELFFNPANLKRILADADGRAR